MHRSCLLPYSPKGNSREGGKPPSACPPPCTPRAKPWSQGCKAGQESAAHAQMVFLKLIESWRLEKTSQIIKSNRHPNTILPAKPCPKVPHRHVLHIFWTPFRCLGMEQLVFRGWFPSWVNSSGFWDCRILWSCSRESCRSPFSFGNTKCIVVPNMGEFRLIAGAAPAPRVGQGLGFASRVSAPAPSHLGTSPLSRGWKNPPLTQRAKKPRASAHPALARKLF